MIHASVAQLRRALDAGQLSSVELTRLFLARIEALNPQLNAFISIDTEGAIAAATAADARIAAGKAGALTGIPLAHQDALCTSGLLSSAGSKTLANFVSPYDAHVVSLLKDAGAVMLGKTNMDEFGIGKLGEESFFGAVPNPWNAEHVSGGSASGSASAVAAGLSPLGTALDSCAGLRQPAAWNGVTAIRPSYGLISRHGLIPYAPSFDQASACAVSAADCALLLQAMSGFDERDATSIEQQAALDLTGLDDQTTEQPLRGLRLGLPQALLAEADPAVMQAFDAALALFRQLGAELVNIELPSAGHAVAISCALGSAEASTCLSRFDGLRFGYRAAEYQDLNDLYCKSRGQGFGSEVKERILLGTHVLSQACYQTHYLQAQRMRRQLTDELLASLAQCDFILSPTTTRGAPRRGELSDTLACQQLDAFTSLASIAGLPAISLPGGVDQHGLPLGLQLVGPRFAEAGLLRTAHRFQQHSDWHQRRQSLFA